MPDKESGKSNATRKLDIVATLSAVSLPAPADVQMDCVTDEIISMNTSACPGVIFTYLFVKQT